MTERSAIHDTFTIERTYPVTPSRVFAAFASEEAKSAWGDTGEQEPADDRTRPLASSTCTCWRIAARDMASGLPSSLTDAGPSLSRSTIRRRPGSARA